MGVPGKIHIIGSTGSGKTYLAMQLSARYNIPYYELDDAMWSRSVNTPGKNPPEVWDRLLHDMIGQDAWIVEGVYHLWTSQSFSQADRIVFLTPHVYLRDLRIISRFMKQRTGLEPSNYKQSVKGLWKMLKWNHKFERITKKEIMDYLKPYKNKLILMKSNKQPLNWDMASVEL
jgi:adenylate kinase family enzyme